MPPELDIMRAVAHRKRNRGAPHARLRVTAHAIPVVRALQAGLGDVLMGELADVDLHDTCYECHESERCEDCHGRDPDDLFQHADTGWPLGLYHGWLGAFAYFWILERDPWQELFG